MFGDVVGFQCRLMMMVPKCSAQDDGGGGKWHSCL